MDQNDHDTEFAQWISTGTFLDQLNTSVVKLSEALDRNTAIAQSLDHRLVILEQKELQRTERERVEAVNSLGTSIRGWSTHIGDWLDKQKSNKLVLLLAVALIVSLVPAMKDIIVDAVRAITPGK